MKKIFPVIAIAAGAAFLYYKGLHKTLTGLRANLTGIKFLSTETKQAGYSRLYFKLFIAVENPNDTIATVTQADFALSHAGKTIATAQETGDIVLKAKSRTVIGFEVVTPVSKLFTVIADAVKAVVFKQKIEFTVYGEVKVSGIVLNINETKEIAWPTT